MTLFDGRLGVMQGRLLPKYSGRYQAHPLGSWQDEFAVAAGFGLNLIEFILDLNDAEQNPLLNQAGLDEIVRLGKSTGVQVKTICADYFMDAPLHASNASAAADSVSVLSRLITNAASIGVTDIVIPCVDQSSLKTAASVQLFCDQVAPLAELAGTKAIKLCLETDLGPQEFAALLDRIGSPHVAVNYDTGNSASLGFDPAEELAVYGDRITDIHIKDRVRGGGSVELGQGDAQFDRFFAALVGLDFRGPFIMQAYRDDEGVEIFRRQLLWVKERYGSLSNTGISRA
ncbi:sugar phosphate isomerase/epimerase family protein [Devosia sp.]|uniref:sugar phosphate isomerase/epimerase family protein n=1 Tax=Devosia sp. TaxID=1871048 RepID=UPI003264B7BD